MSERAKYRVAMVAACPFPSLRGSQVLIRELGEKLAESGHSVHVVTYPTAQHIVPVERIAIHRVPRLPGLWTGRPFGWQKFVLDACLFFLLLRVVRRERIQIIHAHNLEAPLVSFLVRALTGVPVVYHAHNALSDELPCYVRSRLGGRIARRAGEFLDRLLAHQSNLCVALSDRLGAFLAMRGASGRVMVIPPGFDHAALRQEGGRRRAAGPVIMYAGNLDAYQNLGCLLEGFDRVSAAEPRARLEVVTHETTDRKLRRQMAALARRTGVSVRTVNAFAQTNRALRRADVLVCPRTSWSGFPIKVLNYMATGAAIVHAKGSAHAVEHDVNGVLFVDDDPISLARAILRVVRDPALAARLGREAQRSLKRRFSWSRILPLVDDAYRRVLEDGAPGAGADHGRAASIEARRNRRSSDMKGERYLRARLSALAVMVLLWVLPGCASKQPEPLAPLPPVSAEPVPAPTALTPTYRLQPGDVLRVKFLYHPELDVKVPIAPDGTVTVQGVGEILAQQKTADELARNIEEESSDRLREPVVNVIVAQLGPRNVYVGGEVRLPGPVPFREGMTPLQAIMDRGGFTEVARTDSVLHLRVKDNSYDAVRVDLSRNIDKGAPEMSSLQVYDVIYVPRNFIGDANAFVRLYIRGILPTEPRISYPIAP